MRKLIVLLLLPLLTVVPVWGALGTNTVYMIDASATPSNANGGGFNPRNANMATDLACTSPTGTAPVCTSASYNFGTLSDTNAWLFVQGGTNWNTNGAGNNGKGGGCWYKISSTGSNAATVDAAVGHAVCISDGGAGSGVNVSSNVPFLWVTNTLQGIANGSYVAGTASGTWTVDYSHTTGAAISYTDMAATTTTYTSTITPVGKSIIGNLISVNSGTTCTVQRVEVISTSGTTATIDKTIGGSGLTCSGNLGGEISLGSAVTSNTDLSVFNLCLGTAGTGGSMFWIKNGSYTLGTTVTQTNAGVGAAHCVIAGYNLLPGDYPTILSGNAPSISTGANIWTLANFTDLWSLNVTGSGTATVIVPQGGMVIGSKFTNTSTTASRKALYLNTSQNWVINTEAVSYRGRAVEMDGSSQFIWGSYLHDSDSGLFVASGSTSNIVESTILANNITTQLNYSVGDAGNTQIIGNTLYGREAQMSTCLNFASAQQGINAINNIFYGCATAVSQVDTNQAVWADYNDYFNNGTDVTKFFKGPNDKALNPAFVSVAEHLKSGTVTSSTNVLTDSTQDFSFVTNDVDFVNILGITGTGGTTGVYPIHSHTTTTITLATPAGTALNLTSSGAGSAITYSITTGKNWAIGTAVRSLGFPGVLPGGLSTGYAPIGALVPQCSASAATPVCSVAH